MTVLPRRHRMIASILLSCLAVLPAGCRVCLAQTEDQIDPTGGLRSRDPSPPPPSGKTSREELMRQWDLDFNGSIDPSEAAVARARMRRSRQEIEANSEIDPLTGIR